MSLAKRGVKRKAPSPIIMEKAQIGYLNESQIEQGVVAIKKYIKERSSRKSDKDKPTSLLDAGEKDLTKKEPIFVEVVFKKIPMNNKTYIHNIVLPHHWRKNLEPEEYNLAIFVPHKKPETEAQKIQFARDRELDIENTHSYYNELFELRMSEANREKISRIITSKELATEYNTYSRLDKLSKTYDLFLGDKRLMANKFNALPRRLGRRFWVREKKVPLIIKLTARNVNERFEKVMSTEPFYILGRTSTEKIKIGLNCQKSKELVKNIETFLNRLYSLYGDKVRFIRLRTNRGLSLPLFADLNCDTIKQE